jgi:hypothetical protein
MIATGNRRACQEQAGVTVSITQAGDSAILRICDDLFG